MHFLLASHLSLILRRRPDREPDKKKQKDTRKDKLKMIYASIKKAVDDYNELAPYLFEKDEVAKKLSEPEYEKLDSEKIYLYFIQCGRCMYSGERIDLNNLAKYEIDHILPRSLIVKNGFENKALVLKEKNQRKRNFAIDDEIIRKQKPFWNQLLKVGLIGKEKYNNLTKDNWTEDDLKGFVDRQLVETAQINKAFAVVLKTAYPELEYNVKPIKAKLSTLLRVAETDCDPVKYGNFFKLRNLNDYHHAKDAYLAGIMGLFTTYYFPSWGQDRRALELKTVLEKESSDMSDAQTQGIIKARYGIIIDALREGQFETNPDDEGEIYSSVKMYNHLLANMDRYDIPIVKLKEQCANAAFYNQQPISATEIGNKLPLRYIRDKEGNKIPLDPNIYGGYSGAQQAYFVKVS